MVDLNLTIAALTIVFARVFLTQTFQNESEDDFRAKYIFPVPARAAICAFEMETERGEVIRGIVEEKGVAAAKHKRAMEEGKVTGLVAWATDDGTSLFFILSKLIRGLFSVHSFSRCDSQPAKHYNKTCGTQKFETPLWTPLIPAQYTIDLTKNGRDEVRFHLPMYVGERFGAPPQEIRDSSALNVNTRVDVVAIIQMAGKIQQITSPTHPALAISAYPAGKDFPAHDCRVAEYRSSEFLQEDFVINIKAQGLDQSYCFAERNKDGHIAMELSLVPDLEFPRISSQEYIFLVDRSGSMEGLRMEKAKKTLVMLLRYLPAEGTTFNIFGFGNTCKQMSLSSLEYNQPNLQSAVR